MLNIYFGEWGSGRLQRLPYLGYHVLIMFLVVFIAIGLVFAMGLLGSLMSGNIKEIENIMGNQLGILASVLFTILILSMIIGQINIFAKRIRDMGLPVIWTILGIIVISMALNLIYPPQDIVIDTTTIETAQSRLSTASATMSSSNSVVALYNLMVFLLLIFVPSDTFRKN